MGLIPAQAILVGASPDGIRGDGWGTRTIAMPMPMSGVPEMGRQHWTAGSYVSGVERCRPRALYPLSAEQRVCAPQMTSAVALRSISSRNHRSLPPQAISLILGDFTSMIDSHTKRPPSTTKEAYYG